jgi:ligand-binding sensor domain-containing protein/signal transduction histidine kinase
LSRFDGSQFVSYTVASGLPHIHVNDVLETRAGEYWVATDGGISRFHPDGRPKRFVTFVPPGSPDAQRVNTILEDRDGSILLGTSAGLYRLPPHTADVRFERMAVNFPNDVPEGSMVSSLHLDRQDALWVASLSGLYRRDKDGVWQRLTTHNESVDFINSITEDPEGQLWICTRYHGFGRLAATEVRHAILDPQFDVTEGLPDHDVRELWFSSDGRRWAATSSGLVDWTNPSAPRVLANQDGLSDDSIYALTEDPVGNLWIGTRRGGVMRMAQGDWKTFDHSDGLPVGQDEMILETRAGEICVADFSNPRRVIRCLESNRFVEFAPVLPPDIAGVTPNSSEMIMQDHSDAWWISTSHGLLRFQNRHSARALAKSSASLMLSAVKSTRLFEDSHGDTWLAVERTQGTGVLRWERATERFRDESELLPAQFSSVRISAFSEDPLGQMWIGLAHSALLLRQRNGRFERVPNSLVGRINALFVDHAKRLWVASLEGGLGRVDDPTASEPRLQVITRAQGLSSNEVWCIVEDRFGRIYAGNARGVDRIDPESGEILHYTEADGLVPGDIRSAVRDRNGDLWFLSNRGAARFRPTLDSSVSAPMVRITGVQVAGNPLSVSDLGETALGPLELSSRQNSLTVDFGAIDYSTPSSKLYQYRLEGAEGDWSAPSPNSSVTLANVSPGTYTFRVRSTSAAGASNATAVLKFTILPPFWMRWWFLLMLAVGVAATAYGLHRIQLERQLALERVRSGIAMDLHDDMGASLARMAVISEVMKSNVSPADLDSQLMLNDIAQTSRRLVDGMGDIVWSIDPRHQHLGDTVERLRDFAGGILEAKGIQWQLDAAPRALSVTFSAAQRRQLYLIFKEAIHNIAKHSEARRASLKLSVELGTLRAEITDDGRGIRADDGHGMGLRSMRSRAADLGGTLEILSATPQGTRITLCFPIRSKNA